MTIASERSAFADAEAKLSEYIANPGHFPDPYPMFRALRDVQPVYWCDAGLWMVLGHPEGRQAFSDQRLSRGAFVAKDIGRFGELTSEGADALEIWSSVLPSLDNPDHGKVRPLVQHAFSPKAIKQWEATISRSVADLVADLRHRDTFDLLDDFAYRLPSQVIADIMGVPRADHKLFEQWTADWLNSNFTDPRAERHESAVQPLKDFVAYVRAIVQERRQRTTTSEDLTSFLLNAEEEGDRLTEQQLIAAVLNIIMAGHETTANLIGNGFFVLMENPDQLAALAADPSLINSAVEECLRYETPARSQPRIALEDLPLGDVMIRKGDMVQVHVGAANRDGRVFDNPDTLDIRRQPNKNIAFGYGMHFCIGMHIARLEARYALAALVRDVGALEKAGDMAWRNGHVRGLTSFPLRHARKAAA